MPYKWNTTTSEDGIDVIDTSFPFEYGMAYICEQGTIGKKGFDRLVGMMIEKTGCDQKTAKTESYRACVANGVIFVGYDPEVELYDNSGLKAGDHVGVGRVVYDTWVSFEGTITQIKEDDLYVEDRDGVKDLVGIDSVWYHESAPEKSLPSWAVGWCHYCGMPAKAFGFFGEPTCDGCR